MSAHARPSNAQELADALDALVANPNVSLYPNESAALTDAAQQLRKGSSPLYVIGRLLRPFLAALGRK